MKEFPYRHCFTPWHFGTRLERIIDVLQMIVSRIIRDIGQWHIGIHELHCLKTLAMQCIKNIEIITTYDIATSLKSLCNFAVFIEIFIC